MDEIDLLQYLHEDADTAVIMIYLEELRKGEEFISMARQVTSGNRPTPVLVVKSGRTSAGAAAAASHTGALAGTEAVYDAIFKQSGIIRAESVNELFDFADAFAYKQESPLGKTPQEASDREARGHRDQRRRAGDPRHGHDRLGGPRTCPVQRGDHREPGQASALDGQYP